MEAIGQYCLRVTVAGIVCGIITHMISDKGTIGALIKLICGVFMMLCVIGPWTDIRFQMNNDLTDSFYQQSQQAISDGEKTAIDAMAQYISDQVGAYILDKAESLGAQLAVEVMMTEDNPPVPCGVRLSGQVSPYARQVLTKYISDTLGIHAEDQKWVG